MGEPVYAQLHATNSEGMAVDGRVKSYAIADYCYNMLPKYEKYNQTKHVVFKTLLVDILNYGAAAETYSGVHAINAASRDYVGKLVNSLDEFAAYAKYATKAAPDKSAYAYNNQAKNDAKSINAKIVGKQPVLGDTVSIRFYIAAAYGVNLEGCIARIDIPNLDGTYRVWEKKLGAPDAKGYYTVLFEDFNASHMDVKFTLTVCDGNVKNRLSDTLEYSIATYYEKHKTDGNKLADVVTAMMKYGDSAKAYVGAWK